MSKHLVSKNPSMSKLDPDEEQVAVIYRHPFGIMALYAQVGFGLLAAAALIFLIMPNFVARTDNPALYVWFGIGLLAVAVFMAVILLAATAIYHQNKMVITNKAITEFTQIGLFDRRVSQLALGNIEDATSIRKGFAQTMLDYGTLDIETAAEAENFYFHYCPNPDKYAKMVLELRENAMTTRAVKRDEASTAYAISSGKIPHPTYMAAAAGAAAAAAQHQQQQADQAQAAANTGFAPPTPGYPGPEQSVYPYPAQPPQPAYMSQQPQQQPQQAQAAQPMPPLLPTPGEYQQSYQPQQPQQPQPYQAYPSPAQYPGPTEQGPAQGPNQGQYPDQYRGSGQA